MRRAFWILATKQSKAKQATVFSAGKRIFLSFRYTQMQLKKHCWKQKKKTQTQNVTLQTCALGIYFSLLSSTLSLSLSLSLSLYYSSSGFLSFFLSFFLLLFSLRFLSPLRCAWSSSSSSDHYPFLLLPFYEYSEFEFRKKLLAAMAGESSVPSAPTRRGWLLLVAAEDASDRSKRAGWKSLTAVQKSPKFDQVCEWMDVGRKERMDGWKEKGRKEGRDRWMDGWMGYKVLQQIETRVYINAKFNKL